jgi:succinate dehydrogenase / fumarate reductase cytochrome b subunit
VSILHRISGCVLMLALPLLVWLFDRSLSSEASYDRFGSAFNAGIWIFSAWMLKAGALALIWAYLHHFIAGLRHLWMDATHSVNKEFGHVSATFALAASAVLTLALGVKLFV